MRILFLSQYYPPETGAAANRISGLARHLARLGNDVTVLTGFPNYPQGKLISPYRNRLRSCEWLDNIRIIRSYVFVTSRRGNLSRLLNCFSFVLSSILVSICDKKRYDVLFVSSPPIFLGISGYVISKLKRCPYILDIRDIWPDIGIILGELKKNSLITRAVIMLEGFLYKKSAIVSVVTHLKLQLLKEKGINPNKIRLIRNGVDEEFIRKDQMLDRQTEKDRSGFILIYAGLLGKAQGIDIIISAAARVRSIQPAMTFLIIGDGPEKDDLVAMAAREAATNVRFLPAIQRDQIILHLMNADVAIIPLKNSNLIDSVPSKLYEYMGLGCPVILCASGESRDILVEAGAGLAVNPDNVAELVDAILTMHDDLKLRMECSRNGINYAKKNCLRSDIANYLQQVIIELLESRRYSINKEKGARQIS